MQGDIFGLPISPKTQPHNTNPEKKRREMENSRKRKGNEHRTAQLSVAHTKPHLLSYLHWLHPLSKHKQQYTSKLVVNNIVTLYCRGTTVQNQILHINKTRLVVIWTAFLTNISFY